MIVQKPMLVDELAAIDAGRKAEIELMREAFGNRDVISGLEYELRAEREETARLLKKARGPAEIPPRSRRGGADP